MDWSLVLNWAFVIALITAGIRLAVPLLLAVLGEIITERAGVLNLGLEGVMAVGACAGFMAAYFLQAGPLAGGAIWLGLLAGMLAGMALGLILSLLSITLKADQVICGVTLVVFGNGIANYFYRQAFSSLTARTGVLPVLAIPGLSQIPVIGDVLFKHDATVYMTALLVPAVWFFLFRTTWGLQIRSVGENPAAGSTSGVNVARTRYVATLIGTALAGLGGAVLTVAQLHLFREGIVSGRGWIAVALVIFARWRPGRALFGAMLFGLADSIQYRIQALSQVERGMRTIPYEFLLMLPYLLTILALVYRGGSGGEAPAALGRAYIKGSD
jgi:general nucleoside transport system permease protein